MDNSIFKATFYPVVDNRSDVCIGYVHSGAYNCIFKELEYYGFRIVTGKTMNLLDVEENKKDDDAIFVSEDTLIFTLLIDRSTINSLPLDIQWSELGLVRM